MDVKIPLILYLKYREIPDLRLRLNRSTTPTIHTIVDIMPQAGSASDAIAQGFIEEVGCTWYKNNKKLSKNQVLISVQKVFDVSGIIHYLCTKTKVKAYSCSRSTHGNIYENCDFYVFSQFGKPPFTMVELQSIFQLYNEENKYPDCVYENDTDTDEDNESDD